MDFIHQILAFWGLAIVLSIRVCFRTDGVSIPFVTCESSRKMDTQVKSLADRVGPGVRFGKLKKVGKIIQGI